VRSFRFLAKLAAALHREPKKRDVISRYIPFSSPIQKRAFSGLSMRNRGILEKEPQSCQREDYGTAEIGSLQEQRGLDEGNDASFITNSIMRGIQTMRKLHKEIRDASS
jgi:hypothetical protein